MNPTHKVRKYHRVREHKSFPVLEKWINDQKKKRYIVSCGITIYRNKCKAYIFGYSGMGTASLGKPKATNISIVEKHE